MSQNALKQSPLVSIHQKLGARMIKFAGWEMPLWYSTIAEEHKAVRQTAGLFDVSHMGEIVVSGPGALQTLQGLTTNDVERLKIGEAQYTLLTTNQGTCIDDLIITRVQRKKFLLVVNAANVKVDFERITTYKAPETTVSDISLNNALLALQGPNAQRILSRCTRDDIAELGYFKVLRTVIRGSLVDISRTGYTGENGFEIMIPTNNVFRVWSELMEQGCEEGLIPCGLGARDTLRLEAGLPLFGHELDTEHTVLEANLGRFVRFDKNVYFSGKAALENQRAKGLKRVLVAFEMKQRGIPRSRYEIQSRDDEVIGRVTSGAHAHTLNKDIGMGYVEMSHAAVGNDIFVVIHRKPTRAQIVKLPFYHRKSAKKEGRQ